MRIYFIRHGETTANIEQRYSSSGGSPLTEKGIIQDELLIGSFPVENISRIYTSPLDRCISLAEELGQKSGIVPITDERIMEFKFGIFDNLTWKQAEKTYPSEFNQFCESPGNYKIPEGESQIEFNERVSRFLKDVLKDESDAVIITHAGVIRSALSEILGLEEEQKWIFKIMNASVTLIEICDGHACLVLQEVK
jgi:broad specificity phosphatase PhoE